MRLRVTFVSHIRSDAQRLRALGQKKRKVTMGFPCGRIPLSESARNPIGDEIEQKFAEKGWTTLSPKQPRVGSGFTSDTE